MPIRVALLVLGLTGAACGDAQPPPSDNGSPPGDPIPGDAIGTADADPHSIVVESVVPNRGEATGGTLVEIAGSGFPTSVRVFFGETMAPAGDTLILDDTHVQTVSPPSPAGAVPVRVVGLDGTTGTLNDGFMYFEPVAIRTINPIHGPAVGGVEVILEGPGLIDGTEVRFGDAEPTVGTLIAENQLGVVTPRLAAGRTYSVTATNDNGSSVLPAIFEVYAPLRIHSIAPAVGALEGGTIIDIQGTGFVAPAAVSIGGQPVRVRNGSTTTSIAAVVPAAFPMVEGPVDVVVTNYLNSTFVLHEAFYYYDTEDLTPRVVGLRPDLGVSQGGTPVFIAGAPFDSPPTEVFFDAEPAACEIVSDVLLACTTPSIAYEGPVDVRVANFMLDVTLFGAFEYVDLRIDSVSPQTGSVSGGTLVELQGNGFVGDVEVYVDDLPAREVRVASGSELSFKTPPGREVATSIRVVSNGLELLAVDGFTYTAP